ncbi:hypothetical protein PoB_001208500 [Plakobranchus ocellatus]|uniref:Uncharacterized protein n=1 Tax=Plakobranchus ocellatus TaxID=259542 RepID=A0AAV3YR19_9GAST|nr:hypothetical protein PoB_001208500 [Plakobranchus ocellatus]
MSSERSTTEVDSSCSDHTAGDTREMTIVCIAERPVHNKVISGFQALRQARAPVAGLEPATEGPCRSQGGLTSHCATDAPYYRVRVKIRYKIQNKVISGLEALRQDGISVAGLEPREKRGSGDLMVYSLSTVPLEPQAELIMNASLTEKRQMKK